MNNKTTLEMMYNVVLNHEEQYSIWAVHSPIPKGWSVVGEAATKDVCLQRIETLWTDMRPLSMRKKLAESINQSSVDHNQLQILVDA